MGEVTIETVSRECAALRIRMAARAVTRAYDDALRPLGLRVTQFTLLASIALGAPGSISALAELLAMERTTLTRNLRLLEKEGLVAVGPEGYRRARGLRLTAAGRRKLDQALPKWREAQDHLVLKLGANRWRNARALLLELARKV